MEGARTVDARGLPCPQPVILTRSALREFDQVVTIVDSETSQHNVTRMAEKAGYTVVVEKHHDGIALLISRGETAHAESCEAVLQTPLTGPLVLLAPCESMGRGDDELGHILIRAFLHALGEVEPVPDTLIFINSGVRLTIAGSPILEDLRGLHDQGVEILVCGTCLKHYELANEIAVGEISNMYAIAETMLRAGKVVSL
ncbi:MAG: sulfurtransferase-like selenium metabolism protein YedF [Chloroflexi bacterium]|nr:sulfurtransferase-like selenium metabolism protein YedF [Chloroflexota bacterium]